MSLKRRPPKFTFSLTSLSPYNIKHLHTSPSPLATMANNIPSIQTFYKPEVRLPANPIQTPSPTKPGDGFTEEELSDALDPLHKKWNPEREYEEFGISQLAPGPRAVTFVGRVVNVKTIVGVDKKQPKAKGFHALVLRDDEAAVSIKLYFANTPYPLKLGHLLSIWTAFISDTSKTDIPKIPGVLVYANLFPGRVTSDHVMIHTNASSSDGICRTPLEYKRGQPLPGLMTLNSYLSSGHDGVTGGAKILVCVKSIGGKKKISRKDGGGESELADVMLFDHTGEVRLTVWNEMIESAKSWKPGETVLLISNPGYRVGFNGKGNLAIIGGTMVDVEPEGADAEWLRKLSAGLTKKESLCLTVSEEWDVEACEYGVNRMLFTLVELDNWVRSDGNQTFSGFLSVTVLEMNLVSIHRRNMLMCAECCGVPIFSNNSQTPCRNCSKPLTLALNPRIVGLLADETGCIATGKLVWSPRAWEKLFGRTVDEISAMTSDQIRLFEQRVLLMRLHLVVGWEVGLGRLAVLGVMIRLANSSSVREGHLFVVKGNLSSRRSKTFDNPGHIRLFRCAASINFH
ncbi:hypothetical protein N431DRAFT_542887 [Stipitochalara longipes BDJ]|nr:hypothetical protein N431DRAFT_542887 [Stipitochalara longipes BDJ]